MEIEETLYFKDGDKIVKAEYGYDDDPISPREYRDNLGTMVFKDMKNYRLGDEQVNDWDEFFMSEHNIYDKLPVENHVSINFSKNEKFFEKFVAGNAEIGYYTDKPLVAQFFDEFTSNLKETLGENCEDISAGIPVKSNQQLKDKICIYYTTPEGNDITSRDEYEEIIFNTIKSELEQIGIKNIQKDEAQVVDISSVELCNKWAKTKACVVPISVYEHSGITCYPTQDSGNVSGFVFVEKDNDEYQLMVETEGEEKAKEWATNILKGEIAEYARYIEGDTHFITTSVFDKETLTWKKNDTIFNILGGDISSAIDQAGFNFEKSNELSEEQINRIENTPTVEFTEKTLNEYFAGVKEELKDFDNDVLYAAKSMLKQWTVNANNNIGKFDLKKEVVENFLTTAKCKSEKDLKIFLNSMLPQKEISKNLSKKKELNFGMER